MKVKSFAADGHYNDTISKYRHSSSWITGWIEFELNHDKTSIEWIQIWNEVQGKGVIACTVAYLSFSSVNHINVHDICTLEKSLCCRSVSQQNHVFVPPIKLEILLYYDLPSCRSIWSNIWLQQFWRYIMLRLPDSHVSFISSFVFPPWKLPAVKYRLHKTMNLVRQKRLR